MIFFYVELDVGSDASMLIENITHLVRLIKHDYFFSIQDIQSHFQFLCVNLGILGVRDLS